MASQPPPIDDVSSTDPSDRSTEPPSRGAIKNVLKETMIQAGIELLDRDELTVATDSISYTKVFEHMETQYSVRVTRGSVHERIWASHEAFRRDVLAEAVAYLPTGGLPSPAAMDLTYSVATARDAELDPWARIADFGRRVGHRLYGEAMASEEFGHFQAAKAVASRYNDPAASETLHRLINKRVEETGAEVAAKSPTLITMLGLRPKASLGLEQPAASELDQVLRRLLMDGAHLNSCGGSSAITSPIEYMSVAVDVDAPWLPATIGANSIYQFLFEIEPDQAGSIEAPTSQWVERSPPPIDPESATAGAGRRPRSELKRLVLAAGVELLLQRGLELKPESLSYPAVMAHVRDTRGLVVHRGSVHRRIWDSHEEFRLEVLGRAIRVQPEPHEAVISAFEGHHPTLRPDGVVDREQTAMDLFRTTTKVIADVSVDSASYRLLILAKASLINRPKSDTTNTLRAAIERADRERVDDYKTLFASHILGLGFQVRPDTEMSEGEALELIGILAMATMTGAILGNLAGVQQASRTYSLPRIDGIEMNSDWTPTAIAIAAYFDQTYQLN